MGRTPVRSTNTPTAVLKAIADGRFERLYILAGPDRPLADEIIAALRSALITPGFEAFDLESAHGDEASVAQLLEHAPQAPIVSRRRLTVLRDAERLRDADFRLLCTGLAGLRDGNTFVVTLNPEKSQRKAINDAGLTQWVVELSQPGSEALPGLLERWAAAHRLRLRPEAAQLLLEIAGDDTATLRSELEKFALALGPDAELTTAEIQRLAGRSRQFQIRNFITRLMTGDTAGALIELENLARTGESPIAVLSWLEGSFFELERLLAGLIPERAAWRTRQFADRWRTDPATVRRSLLRLYDIHRLAVSTRRDVWTLLAQFTVCTACRQPEECSLFSQPARPDFCLRRMQRRAAAKHKLSTRSTS